MMSARVEVHDWVEPPPGHVDGPNACHRCGRGPFAAVHPQPAAFEKVWAAAEDATRKALHAKLLETRIALAVEVANNLGVQLAALTGSDGGRADHVLAYAHGALLRVTRALDGETDPDRLRFAGPMPMPPRQEDKAEQLPMIGAA